MKPLKECDIKIRNAESDEERARALRCASSYVDNDAAEYGKDDKTTVGASCIVYGFATVFLKHNRPKRWLDAVSVWRTKTTVVAYCQHKEQKNDVKE